MINLIFAQCVWRCQAAFKKAWKSALKQVNSKSEVRKKLETAHSVFVQDSVTLEAAGTAAEKSQEKVFGLYFPHAKLR